MISGIFIDNTPLIQITVGWKSTVRTPFAILDTGFTGDLQVNKKIAEDLGLEPMGATSVKIADGQTIQVKTALAVADMEGEKHAIEVIISNGAPLIGIGLLSKLRYETTIDCKNKTINLEQAK